MSAPVTMGLAAITAAAWLVAAIVPGLQLWLVEQAGFIPLRLSASAQGFLLPAVVTPLTAAFVHGGFFHLFTNLLMLTVCGRAVEGVIGRNLLICLYAVGAIGAAAAQFVADPLSPVPMIGASGAIAAVIAVYAMLFGRDEVRAIGPIPSHWVRALWLAAGWIGIQLLIGVATALGPFQIAVAAHIGGFLIGLALARPLLAWRYRDA